MAQTKTFIKESTGVVSYFDGVKTHYLQPLKNVSPSPLNDNLIVIKDKGDELNDTIGIVIDWREVLTPASLSRDALAANLGINFFVKPVAVNPTDYMTKAAYDAAGKNSQVATIIDLNTAITGVFHDCGNYDASTNLFPEVGGTGALGVISKGDVFVISVGGTLGGVAVQVGDTIRAMSDLPVQTLANWTISEGNFGYVAENSANKSIDFTTIDDVKYPTAKAVYDWATGLFAKLTSNTFTDKQLIKGTTNDGTTNILELFNSDNSLVKKFDTNGFQNYEFDDILPSSGWIATSGGAAPDLVAYSIGGVNFSFWSFDGVNTTEQMTNYFEIIHGIDVDSLNAETVKAEIHTHGFASTNDAGNVQILIDMIYMPMNAAPISYTPLYMDIPISANQQYFHKIKGVEFDKPSSGFTVGDKMLVRYSRVPQAGADTYTHDWAFMQCAMHMPFNSNGSRQRYIK